MQQHAGQSVEGGWPVALGALVVEPVVGEVSQAATDYPEPVDLAERSHWQCRAPILQVALAMGLHWRLEAAGASVRCFAADPGEVLTDITRTLPPPLRSAYRALLPWILFTPAQGEVAALNVLMPGHLQHWIAAVS